jgi:hypothetical protein
LLCSCPYQICGQQAISSPSATQHLLGVHPYPPSRI